MAAKHASFYSGFFCSNSNKHLVLNCSGNGNVAKLYLKQQAENKSTVPAARGDLGRYRDKAKSCYVAAILPQNQMQNGDHRSNCGDVAVYNI